MPIYEYRCNDCEQIFEEWQTTFEDKDLDCPICGGSSQRVMSNTSFVLKGSGWYTTDYCNRSTNGNGNGNGNGDGKAKTAEASSGTTGTTKSDSSSSPATTPAADAK